MYDTGKLTKDGNRLLVGKRPSNCPLYSYIEVPVPCGRCPACLENKRREWCGRMEVELLTRPESSFITLTYDDEHLPFNGLVNKRDVQLFLKRFRQVGRKYKVKIPSFKYFIVSEYGAKKHRPHYHGILFGIDFSSGFWQSYTATLDNEGHPIKTSPILADSWCNGFVSFDKVTPSSIRYVSKYITKTQDNNFRLCSLGIGRDYFVDFENDILRPSAIQAADLGYIVLRSKHGFYKRGTPRFLDRYFKKLAPDILEKIKARRKDFVSHLNPDSLVKPSVQAERIQHLWKEENRKRRYDNEN